MKTPSLLLLLAVTFFVQWKAYAQDRYWVGQSTYQNTFSTTTELDQWELVEDNGTGSWELSENGSAVLTMDDAAGSYANRLFNVNGGSPNLLPLDETDGIVEFQVTALTGDNQRFFLQVQEFEADGTYISEQSILPAQTTPGYFSVALSSVTWNALTTQIRFMIGGENFSAQQGTIEFNYFNYTNTDKSWSNAANWSLTPGGAGGASVPGASDTAIFDGASGYNGLCFLDAPVTIAGLELDGYTGVLDLRGNDLTVTGTIPSLATANITDSDGSGSLIFSTSGDVTFDGTTFNTAISGSAASIFFNGSVFNNTVSLTKTGSTTDVSNGGNTFNAAVTLTAGDGTLRLADVTGDTFLGDVTFVESGGTIEPGYNGTNEFAGDITVNSASAITFGAGTGTTTFSGTGAQAIVNAGTASPVIEQLIMNKALGELTLNTDVTVGTSATFTSGIINTTATDFLNFADGAAASGAGHGSHVDGPVSKTGNEAFTFPTGDNGFYRPLGISAPGLATDVFTAEYFNAGQGYGSTIDSSLDGISECEHWTLDGSSATNVFVTLSWTSAECTGTYVTDPSLVRVSHWNGTQWENYGTGGTTGDADSGTVTSAVSSTSFSPLALGFSNPLPVTLSKFWATGDAHTVTLHWITQTEKNNDYFTVERSESGIDFEALYKIQGAGSSTTPRSYSFADESPYGGVSYYRLKQTDFDGTSVHHNIISVQRAGSDAPFLVYPNPTRRGNIRLTKKANITLRNSLNQIIMEAEDVDRLDVSGLPAGVYILRNQERQHVRLIIR